MRAGILVLLLGVVLAAGCVADGAPESVRPQAGDRPRADPQGDGPDIDIIDLPEPVREPEPARWLAWGDAGKGNPTQHAVAEAARRVCEREGCDFALHLGDNIYPSGVKSERDPLFESTFERPYANLSIPFYAALGNHDVEQGKVGDAQRDNGDFQVRYALRDDRLSDKWNMPARHYAFREGDVQVLVLDLTALAHDGASVERERAQLDWLDDAWDEEATWHVVVSHFPYVSNGKHGNAGKYDGVEGRGAALKQALEKHVCGKADVYLAGHDHDLQWLKPVPACGDTEFVVSGAAADPRPLKGWNTSAFWEAGEVAGFFWFEAKGGTLTGRAYDKEGNVLFERTLTKDGP